MKKFKRDTFRKTIIIFLFSVSAGTLRSQTIEGFVRNGSTGDPLSGASISVRNTQAGTLTDASGHYSLKVTSLSGNIIFSFVGYETQEVAINGRNRIDINLEPSVIVGNEVVVVGFGTQRRSEVSGAISSISQADFNGGITTSPTMLLEGKLPGIQVLPRSGDPNTAPVVRIRGTGTIRSGSQPLYVVDGVPLSGDIQFLNPDDIATFDVLKGASATAIYGSRASEGVIQVTTKKGHSGIPVLNYNGYVAVSKPGHLIDLLNADEYRDFQTKFGNPSKIFSNTVSTDWLDLVLRTTVSQNHTVSYSGGAENSNYRASLSYNDTRGIITPSSRKSYRGTLSAGQSFLKDRIHLQTNLHGIYIRSDNTGITDDAGVEGDLLSLATIANPTLEPFNADGSVLDFPDAVNPLLVQRRATKFNGETHLLGDIKADAKILPGLVYTVQLYGHKFNINGVDQQNPVPIGGGASDLNNIEGRLSTSTNESGDFGLEQHLEYKFKVKDNSFTVLGGYSYQKFYIQTRNWSIDNFSTTEIDAYRNPGVGTSLTISQNKPGGTADISMLQSFFGRINYNYKNKYLVNASLRDDGSSKFGANRRYGLFPSISGAWNLSNESFLSGSKAVSSLKLRGGWGKTGNQNIPSNISDQLLTVATGHGQGYFFGNTNIAGISTVRAENSDIHWEVSNQVDIGLDFGLFGNRINGSIDYYNKVSSDILFMSSVDPDPIQSTSIFWKNYNTMKIKNKGVELGINYEQPLGADISIGIGGNISFVKSDITGSPILIPIDAISGQGLSGVTVGAILNNQPIGTFYLQNWIGLDQNGLSMYEDVNNDGVINDDDFIAAGHALPSAIFGANINFKYKKFDLTLNFSGVSGNKIYWNDENAYYAFARLASGFNSLKSVAKFGGQESIADAPQPSTRFLHDGSYLRFNNATLSYQIVAGSDGKIIKELRVYATGQNLFTITNYPGYDPAIDTPRDLNGVQSYGVDGTSFPRARTYILGVTFSL